MDQRSSNENRSDQAAYEEMMEQARRYQQQLASSMAGSANSGGLFAGYNPFMMSALPAMAYGSAGFGMLGDYQTQATAAANMAGLHGAGGGLYGATALASMGFPQMDVTTTDYSAAYAALMGSAAANHLAGLNPQENGLTNMFGLQMQPSRSPHSNASQSPAVSRTPRSDVCQTPKSDVSGQRSEVSHTPRSEVTHTPRSESSHLQKNDMSASFYKGMSADEFDVNSHFKHSLGHLYKDRTDTSQVKDSHQSHTNASNDGSLDLSRKSCTPTSTSSSQKYKPHSIPSISNSTNQQEPGGASQDHQIQRTSVIKLASSGAVEDDQPARLSQWEQQALHSAKMTSPTSLKITTQKSAQTLPSSSKKEYDAMPNLKRLSEQLKSESGKPSESSPPKKKATKAVSLLNPENQTSKVKIKVRKGKQQKLEIKTSVVSDNNQIMDNNQDGAAERSSEVANVSGQKKKLDKVPKADKPKVKRPRKTKPVPMAIPDNRQPEPKTKKRAADKKLATSSKKSIPTVRKTPAEKPFDLVKLSKPFEYGWRRETRLRSVNNRGVIVGEVYYYTPRDKRVRTFNDVAKHLAEPKPQDEPAENGTSSNQTEVEQEEIKPSATESTGNVEADVCEAKDNENVENSSEKVEDKPPASSLTKSKPQLSKEHFSFNTKIPLGDFLELQAGDKYVTLTDEQRDQRLQQAQDKRAKQLEKTKKQKLKKQLAKENARKAELAKLEKHRKQQEMSEKALHIKMKRQMEKAKARAQQDMSKQQKVIARLMKKQALTDAKERIKQEKEEKAKMLIEDRVKKAKELQEMKEKRRMEKVMLRERRRQQQLNSKLMEARKREEERRRAQMEKILAKERKMEMKKRELEFSRELKKPVEDLLLPKAQPLPVFERITGLKMTGQVFGNILQVHQFITNFGSCLDLELDIPSLDTFQEAALNLNTKSVKKISAILCHLLKFALKDPGVANPKQFKNELNQRIVDLTVDSFNFSEILRRFIQARISADNDVTIELANKPFVSLGIEMKARAMAWLCDELCGSLAVVEEIDTNMEQISTLKRDKWEVEGEIRQLKTVQERKFSKTVKIESSDSPSTKTGEKEEKRGSDEEASDDEDQATQKRATECKDKEFSTAEEVEKSLEKMSKQHKKLQREVYTCAGKLRTLPLGMDRYRRYYWNLPNFSGVLVESRESGVNDLTGEPSDILTTLAQPEKKPEIKADVKPEVQETKPNPSEETQETPVKTENTDDNPSEHTGPSETVEKNQTNAQQNPKPVLEKQHEERTPNDSSTPANIRVNGFIDKPTGHSVASWLNSTIDSIFNSTVDSSGALNGSKPSPETTRDSLGLPLPCKLPHPTNTSWFDLDKKLSCDSLPHLGPELISSSLAFMSSVVPAEDQITMQALEKLEAKSLLLPEPNPISTDVQRGWWMVPDLQTLNALNNSLHQRGIREKQLSRLITKHSSHIQDLSFECKTSEEPAFTLAEDEKDGFDNPYSAPLFELCRDWVPKECRVWELQLLDRVEDLEERVFQGSMHTKTWAEMTRHPADLDLVITPQEDVGTHQKRIIDLVKEKLLQLEGGIEKRYLKPPFVKSTELQLADILSSQTADEDEEDTESNADDDSPKGLVLWQRAVRSAFSLSQLYICLSQLEGSISWEKSVMKVLCQICRSDDDEDQLLLCDSCDKGYHTYCFKPKMTVIPDGNWYCWECKSKATSVSYCVRCGKSNGKLAVCNKCPQAFHLDCMRPSMQRMPRKYSCRNCLAAQRGSTTSSGRSKSKTVDYEEDDSSISESGADDSEQEESNGNIVHVEFNEKCRTLLGEIEKSKDARAFMKPVDMKAFPQYKKYIKRPMDISTISKKLKETDYASAGEFFSDMILIFDNCLLFNEDDSEVGKAGKALRKLFMKKWKESGLA